MHTVKEFLGSLTYNNTDLFDLYTEYKYWTLNNYHEDYYTFTKSYLN